MTRATEVQFQPVSGMRTKAETRRGDCSYCSERVIHSSAPLCACERDREEEEGGGGVKPGEARILSQSEVPTERLKGRWAASRGL